MVVRVSGQHKIQFSTSRHPKTARVQRYCVGPTLAVLFCPMPDGRMVGVTIDKEDLQRVLAAGPWSVRNFSSARKGFRLYCYSSRKINGKVGYLHRFILNAPAEMEVDHIRNRTLDTRKSEIRLASKSLNQRNKHQAGPPNRHGYRGVLATRSGRFVARVFVNHQAKRLGTFDTPELAGEAVRKFNAELGAIA